MKLRSALVFTGTIRLLRHYELLMIGNRGNDRIWSL